MPLMKRALYLQATTAGFNLLLNDKTISSAMWGFVKNTNSFKVSAEILATNLGAVDDREEMMQKRLVQSHVHKDMYAIP